MAAKKQKKNGDGPAWTTTLSINTRVEIFDSDSIYFGGPATIRSGTIVEPSRYCLDRLDRFNRLLVQLGGVLVSLETGSMLVAHHSYLEPE